MWQDDLIGDEAEGFDDDDDDDDDEEEEEEEERRNAFDFCVIFQYCTSGFSGGQGPEGLARLAIANTAVLKDKRLRTTCIIGYYGPLAGIRAAS